MKKSQRFFEVPDAFAIVPPKPPKKGDYVQHHGEIYQVTHISIHTDATCEMQNCRLSDGMMHVEIGPVQFINAG